jgi:hypothetical protein
MPLKALLIDGAVNQSGYSEDCPQALSQRRQMNQPAVLFQRRLNGLTPDTFSIWTIETF